MTGLEGVRAIIVDDKENEVMPMLRAFAARGISAAFFKYGSDEEFRGPEQLLAGIRMAVLDMNLTGGADPRSNAATLVRVLKAIMSSENGPYVIVAWTKYTEWIDALRDALNREQDLPRPVAILPIDKQTCMRSATEFDLTFVADSLRGVLERFSPLLFLTAWEAQCFKAATGVTNALSQLAAPTGAASLEEWRDRWTRQLLQLMRAVAEAQAGRTFNEDSCLNALYSALNPLHADRMENNIADLLKALSGKAGDIVTATGDPGDEARARVNTMLHVATENLAPLAAGNIYKVPQGGGITGFPTLAELLDECVEGEGAVRHQRKAELTAESMLLFVEASPVCDHAQAHIHYARFLAGMAVPVARMGHIKMRGGVPFIWKFEPAYLREPVGPAGTYALCFSARHAVALHASQIGRLTPVCRLRSQQLAELQAWLSSYGTRPGSVVLRRSS